FHYPERPQHVQVKGAVSQPCHSDFATLRTARTYAQACALSPVASTDYLYVIQPDGHIQKQGIASWNKQADIIPAPGATVWVPIADAYQQPEDIKDFNQDAVTFLATQPLDDNTSEAGQT